MLRLPAYQRWQLQRRDTPRNKSLSNWQQEKQKQSNIPGVSPSRWWPTQIWIEVDNCARACWARNSNLKHSWPLVFFITAGLCRQYKRPDLANAAKCAIDRAHQSTDTTLRPHDNNYKTIVQQKHKFRVPTIASYIQYLPLATTVPPCSKGPARPRMIISDKIPIVPFQFQNICTAPCQIEVLQQMEKIIHGPAQTKVIVAAGRSQASKPQARDTLFKSLVATLGCPCRPNYWRMDRKRRPRVYWDSRREELKNQCWLSQDQEPAWWEESIGYVNLKTAFL